MINRQEQLHSTNGKRKILVVDDEMVNREMLGAYLQDTYDVIYAADGEQALQQIRQNHNTLALVLLDILMPVMTGMEVLIAAKKDPTTAKIPIIVLTADQESEIECLNQGAADFIPKPYPDVGVILARVKRTILLSEDQEIIHFTERDALTGVYNKEYFYRYAEQYDLFHEDHVMDAILLDINHFHMINERHGKAYGDEILKKIAADLKRIVDETGGLVCRREADTFLVYCPHQENYPLFLERASASLAKEENSSRIRMRIGVYPKVDKEIDMERRFDRAKMAADTIQGNLARTIAFYDDTLHAQDLYSEQLIEEFETAIREKQFVVYFQPKFDISEERPVLSSAEALVRWVHPDLGMISPGVFIPLFEKNGLIGKLDHYVWRETCRQIRGWIDRFGFHVPVSVNVSRVDLYDPGLSFFLQNLIQEYGLSFRDLMLEITESAYTQDTHQIIEVVKTLQKLGFRIEMDDFGTGYSSLNMVSNLPFDVMKLDMQFIRSAFREGGDTKMLELIVDIAEYLSVPVIAEGVETEEQLNVLKDLGCDLVQGYYFSKPLPAEEYEVFLLEWQEKFSLKKTTASSAEGTQTTESVWKQKSPSEMGHPDADILAKYSKIDELETEAEPEPDNRGKEHTAPQLRTAMIFFLILALAAAILLFIAASSVGDGYRRMEQASDRYIAAQMSATDMESGSDYLTDRVRCFVVTGEIDYLNDFFEEVNVTKRRDQAIINLENLLNGRDNDALSSLNAALKLSNELIQVEHYAMRLKLESGSYDLSGIPEEIRSIALQPEDQDLTTQELSNKAQLLVFDNNYMHYKDRIRENVNLCTQALIRLSSQELEQASARMSVLIVIQSIATIIFLVIVLILVLFMNQMIRKPLSDMVDLMREHKTIPPKGAEELQFVTRTYNLILEENRAAQERLSHEASHDALTGLFNRGAYDMLMESVDTSHMALIIIDVDYFKMINDTYGHSIGDRVLKKVADIMRQSFRSVDILCRFGGDEFVVIMTRVNSSMRQIVFNKIAQANEILQNPKDDLPPVSLSVGVAFSDRKNPQGDIFTDADTALYRVKAAGRNGCEIY